MRSDFELLEAWTNDDARAGEELLGRYAGVVWRFFASKVSPQVADDLCQQTFMTFVERRSNYRGEGTVRGFVMGIARFKLLEFLRSKRRTPEFESAKTSLNAVGTTPSEHLARAQRKRRVQLALREIPIDQQLILELYYWEELSTVELAQCLEVPVGTIKSRLRRARERLAYELDLSAADLEATGLASK